MQKQIKALDWEAILDTIREEKCILFIGPELYRSKDGVSLESQLANYLSYGSNPNIKQFYENDGFFLFLSKAKKTQTYSKVKKFYKQAFPNAITTFEVLSKIPFHLIINVTPDKSCFSTFERIIGTSVHFDYYLKNGEQKQILNPINSSSPLIYNLFGDIEDQSSMVLTHDDLFSYLRSLFTENDFPLKLKSNIREAHNFIFLGFDFRKWYMQLLIRLIYGNNDSGEFMRFAANQELSDDLQTFCADQFLIEFIPNGIHAFVETLQLRCQEEGLKRKTGNEKKAQISKGLLGLIAENQIQEAITEIHKLLSQIRNEQHQEMMYQLTNISGHYKKLRSDELKGTLYRDEKNIEFNKLRNSLISLVKELQALI